MDAATPDLLGGRRPLRALIADGSIPYRDPRRAREFLDRFETPYIICRRQRWYRPAAVTEALERHERQAVEGAA
jgi:hypothetical protein